MEVIQAIHTELLHTINKAIGLLELLDQEKDDAYNIDIEDVLINYSSKLNRIIQAEKTKNNETISNAQG